MLTPQELERYSRHLIIPGLGTEGQMRFKQARVLLIGCGALASPLAMYLAAAGVGHLGIVDADTVDLSNLQRQIVHGESWLGKSKLESAAARLREINPHVRVVDYPLRFTPDNALQIADGYDVIVDGSDNFPTRFLANDTAFFLRVPLIAGAIHQFEGQLGVFAPHIAGPCYRCLLPEMPAADAVPSCAEAGVLGVLPGVIGSLQAMETLKFIAKIGTLPLGKLTSYDALDCRFRSIQVAHDPACKLCGTHPSIHSVDNSQTRTASACQIQKSETKITMETISTAELRQLLANGFDGILIDVREPHEHAMSRIDGARLMPLGTLMNQVDALPKDRDIIIHCKMGMRSARACEMLMSYGFSRVKNVIGGIDAWLEQE